MAKKKILEQPDEEMQSLQKAVMHDKADVVYLRNKKIKLRWIRGCPAITLSKFRRMENYEAPDHRSCRCSGPYSMLLSSVPAALRPGSPELLRSCLCSPGRPGTSGSRL